MTVQGAERITGLSIWKVSDNPVTYAAHDNGVEITRSSGRDGKRAISTLVEVIYNRRRQQVLKRAQWKCEGCGSISPLQVHHKIFRSHGRLDTLENLEALCVGCHDRKHSRKRSGGYHVPWDGVQEEPKGS